MATMQIIDKTTTSAFGGFRPRQLQFSNAIPACAAAPCLWQSDRNLGPGLPQMQYDEVEVAMSKRELIAQELERLPDQDLDGLLKFLRSLADAHAEAAVPALAAESSLAKDWLSAEEDAAWASL